MNRAKMRDGVRLFLEGMAEDCPELLSPDTERTPERVAASWAEDLLMGYGADPAGLVEPVPAGEARGPVVIQDLEFTSVCAHHLLPFGGSVSVVYLPGESLAGFGRVARLVDVLARRLQLQERLTARIAVELERALDPRGVLVVVEGVHSCLALRGPRKSGHRVVTQEVRGAFERDAALRHEALGLLRHGAGD
jgi:GTP cyclohydrolase I